MFRDSEVKACHCGHLNLKHDLFEKCQGDTHAPIKEKCGCFKFHTSFDISEWGCRICGLILERIS